jgi:hypothetical protein
MIGRRRKNPSTYTTVHRADARYVSEHPGIRSLHCFSTGAHYDADNTAFGALVGVDEHLLDPGAAFERHAHRRVAIVTWVISGVLRHEDSSGAVAIVEPGFVAVQVAGTGIEHVEANASRTEPVRFVQSTVLSDVDEPSYRVGEPPIIVPGGALFDVHRSGPLLMEASRVHLFVGSGEFLARQDALYPGDSMRMTYETPMLATQETTKVEGTGELLVLLMRGGDDK